MLVLGRLRTRAFDAGWCRRDPHPFGWNWAKDKMHPAAWSLVLEMFFATRQVRIVLSADRTELWVEVKERRWKGFSFAWRANVIGDRALYFIALTRLMIAQYDRSMMSSLWNQARSIMMSNV